MKYIDTDILEHNIRLSAHHSPLLSQYHAILIPIITLIAVYYDCAPKLLLLYPYGGLEGVKTLHYEPKKEHQMRQKVLSCAFFACPRP